MNYKKIYPENLNYVKRNELNIESIINFFADNPYKLLYVFDDSNLITILSKYNIPEKINSISNNLEFDYVFNLDHYPTNLELESIIKANPDTPRMAILMNRTVLFEISDSDVLNLQRSKIKDLLALRYINTFSEYLNNYFLKNNIKKLLWIGDDTVFDIVKQEINLISIEFRSSAKENENLSNYDAIIDNKYYEFIKYLNITGNIVYFFEILEKEIMHILISSSNKTIPIFLCQLPTFEQLQNCLTELEKKQAKAPKNFYELMKDYNYVESYIKNQNEKAYFKRQDYNRTSLVDDGEKVIQGNISTKELQVNNGIRRTLPEYSNGINRVYILGTCTAFGYCTSDANTIASHLQNLLLKNNLDYTVINKSNMQGRFAINTLITALQCNIKPGDIIIILDYFENYDSEIKNRFIQTADWFNNDKSISNHMFFDYPMHCNSDANRIYANHLLSLIKSVNNENKSTGLSKSLLNSLGLVLKDSYNKYLMIPSIYSHLRELLPYTNIKGTKGIVIIYACPFTKGHKYLIDEALKVVEHLFVFVVTEHFHGYSILDRFDMVREELINYKNVTILPTETYMVSKQYFPEYGKRTAKVDSIDSLCYQERLNAIFLYRTLGITYRFMGEEKEDYVTSIVNREVLKSTAEHNVKCIIIPRKKINNNNISAKLFRTSIQNGNIEQARALVPENTLRHFFTRMTLDSKINLVLHKPISKYDEDIILQRLGKFFMSINVIKKNTKNHFPEANLNIHYGLDGKYTDYSTLDLFIESTADVNDSFINKVMHYFTVVLKKTILYLGKFPDDENDMDGGSQLSYQLIKTLKNKTILDVTFIRKGNQTYKEKGINKVQYVPYKNPKDDKFQRRLLNINTNIEALTNSSEYDLIIAAHCSKLFGLGNNMDVMNKSIIFPMFLTNSYKRAFESVPQNYTQEEQNVLSNVSQIITPSLEEKNDLLSEYIGIKKEKILVIPRGINLPKRNTYNHNIHQIKLVAIGSIKKQKNHLDNLKLLKYIRESGYDASLAIVGSVYDSKIQSELNKYSEKYGLKDVVSFYSGLNRHELSILLSKMSFGISNSNWETFGRGIIECLAAGLPTVVTDKVLVLKNLLNTQKGLYFTHNLDSMANIIIELFNNKDLYEEASKASLIISKRFSLSMESERLLYALLFNRFEYQSEFTLWNLKECQKFVWANKLECYRKNNHIRRMLPHFSKEESIRVFEKEKELYLKKEIKYMPKFIAYDCFNNSYFIDYILDK